MRNRTLLTFLLIFFLGQFLNAQFSVSGEAGANYSNLNWNKEANWDNADPGYGYYFAIIPEYQIGDYFAVKLEVQQSSEVYKYDQFFSISNRFTFTRLIPEIELRFLNSLAILGGYNLGFKSNERENLREVPLQDPILAFEGAEVDHGLLLGFRYEYKGIYFVAKYHHGFRDIDRVTVTDPTGTLFQGETLRSGILQFGLGYRLVLTK